VVHTLYRKRHESCIVLDEGNKTMALTLHKEIKESFLGYFVKYFYSRFHPAAKFHFFNPPVIWIKKGRPPFFLRLPRFTHNDRKKIISPFLMAEIYDSGQKGSVFFASDFKINRGEMK
jgi:hypothetical protein